MVLSRASHLARLNPDRELDGSKREPCADCAGPACSGSQQLAAIRRLAPDDGAVRKMLSLNAARVMKI